MARSKFAGAGMDADFAEHRAILALGVEARQQLKLRPDDALEVLHRIGRLLNKPRDVVIVRYGRYGATVEKVRGER